MAFVSGEKCCGEIAVFILDVQTERGLTDRVVGAQARRTAKSPVLHALLLTANRSPTSTYVAFSIPFIHQGIAILSILASKLPLNTSTFQTVSTFLTVTCLYLSSD